MDTTVSARMDTKLKKEAENVLNQLGISHSTAINALYSQIVLQKGLPFNVQLPVLRAKHSIPEIKKVVQSLAKQYGLKRVYLFGSYARGAATEKSDVDLHVETGKAKGFALGGFQQKVQEALGTDVDIATTKSLSDEFRKEIAKEEILLYEG